MSDRKSLKRECLQGRHDVWAKPVFDVAKNVVVGMRADAEVQRAAEEVNRCAEQLRELQIKLWLRRAIYVGVAAIVIFAPSGPKSGS